MEYNCTQFLGINTHQLSCVLKVNESYWPFEKEEEVRQNEEKDRLDKTRQARLAELREKERQLKILEEKEAAARKLLEEDLGKQFHLLLEWKTKLEVF